MEPVKKLERLESFFKNKQTKTKVKVFFFLEAISQNTHWLGEISLRRAD
jgi:hypothetical protein